METVFYDVQYVDGTDKSRAGKYSVNDFGHFSSNEDATCKYHVVFGTFARADRRGAGEISGRTDKICPSVQRVGSLVRQATEEILPRARQKEIQIEICGDIEGKANFDQKWTQEELYNILDNAVKYSPKGSRIEVEGISYEMYFCIAVKDQGIGIREEERAQIFSRFYRSDLVQQEEGIGIGLYLAREIVQREGGYIKVESKEGNGSIFKIFLQKE